MNKYTLYLGLNDKDKKQQLINTIEAYKICNNILLAYTDGATIFETSGIYKHDDGTVIIEKSLRIELLNVTDDIINKIVIDLKKAFNQEKIYIQKELVNCYMA